MHRYKRLLAVFLFLGLLLAVFELSGLRDHFSLAFLQHRILENKISGLLIFILLFALGNLIQIPGWVFLAAAVLALGRMWGGIATYVAASLSCVMTFFTIRFVGGDALLLRILFQTMPALNYALALSGVKFRNYLIGTLLGLPLPIILYCLFFDYLAKTLKIV
jgi:uncharacterized membrane protein YdjX (TVP38/TMEM64 family)